MGLRATEQSSYLLLLFLSVLTGNLDGFLAQFGTSMKTSQLQLRLTGKGRDLQHYAGFDEIPQNMVCMESAWWGY